MRNKYSKPILIQVQAILEFKVLCKFAKQKNSGLVASGTAIN
jgi:hypothetical protein